LKIVVDTSVIVAVLTNEKHKNDIIQLTDNADLIAPMSLKWEIGNAFSAMFMRGKINIMQAKEAVRYFDEIPIRYANIDLGQSLEISNEYHIYAYDAYFIVCSQNEKAPLLTLDKKLLSISKQAGIKVLEV
jgi:predicted nucleic acid-binding protein